MPISLISSLEEGLPTVQPSSMRKSPRNKKRQTGFIQDTFIPRLYQLALIGLYILFLFYKIILEIEVYSSVLYYFIGSKLRQKNDVKKKIAIVGGGYAGVYAASKLQFDFEVTLFDLKDYYEFTPSRLRMLVEPSHCPRVQMKYSTILPAVNFVQEKVLYVTEHEIATETHNFGFDYLIISTGSRFRELGFPDIDIPLPYQSMSRAKIATVRVGNIEDFYETLETAKKVLIIGGGTVGVELAGEIVDRFDKDVTLVHSQRQLMPRSTNRAIQYTQNFLKHNKVNVILGERIIQQSGNFFRTSNDTLVEADLAFICTGTLPNSELLRGAFPTLVTDSGLVKVNENLQLLGRQNIFVAGDLTEVPDEEEKLCQTAYHEAKIVIANIKNLESNKSLTHYAASPCPMLISLGRYDGILTYRGWTLTGFLPALMKEFVEWKEMVCYWKWGHFGIATKDFQEQMYDRKWRIGRAHIV